MVVGSDSLQICSLVSFLPTNMFNMHYYGKVGDCQQSMGDLKVI